MVESFDSSHSHDHKQKSDNFESESTNQFQNKKKSRSPKEKDLMNDKYQLSNEPSFSFKNSKQIKTVNHPSLIEHKSTRSSTEQKRNPSIELLIQQQATIFKNNYVYGEQNQSKDSTTPFQVKDKKPTSFNWPKTKKGK